MSVLQQKCLVKGISVKQDVWQWWINLKLGVTASRDKQSTKQAGRSNLRGCSGCYGGWNRHKIHRQ